MSGRDEGGGERAIRIGRLPVTLSAFLKLAGAVRSGGEAKELIAAGAVRVNGVVERRRARALVDGDAVVLGTLRLRVRAASDA